VNKASLIEKMAELVREKKLEGISDIRDESDENIRVVVELKRGVIGQVVLNNLSNRPSWRPPSAPSCWPSTKAAPR
jgi:DNA gyrase/topoisomerase IV subunit A